MISNGGGCGGHGKGSSSTAPSSRGGGGVGGPEQSRHHQQQLSLVEFLLAALRRSMVSCRVDRQEEAPISAPLHPMEIGWPTNVQHVAHVTFDRFHGFLGLPLEFQVEIPSRVPSASKQRGEDKDTGA